MKLFTGFREQGLEWVEGYVGRPIVEGTYLRVDPDDALSVFVVDNGYSILRVRDLAGVRSNDVAGDFADLEMAHRAFLMHVREGRSNLKDDVNFQRNLLRDKLAKIRRKAGMFVANVREPSEPPARDDAEIQRLRDKLARLRRATAHEHPNEFSRSHYTPRTPRIPRKPRLRRAR